MQEYTTMSIIPEQSNQKQYIVEDLRIKIAKVWLENILVPID